MLFQNTQAAERTLISHQNKDVNVNSFVSPVTQLKNLVGYNVGEFYVPMFPLGWSKIKRDFPILNKELLVNKRVLIFGAKQGQAVNELRGLGIEAWGIEAVLGAQGRASNWLFRTNLFSTGIDRGFFDVVIATDGILSLEVNSVSIDEQARPQFSLKGKMRYKKIKSRRLRVLKSLKKRVLKEIFRVLAPDGVALLGSIQAKEIMPLISEVNSAEKKYYGDFISVSQMGGVSLYSDIEADLTTDIVLRENLSEFRSKILFPETLVVRKAERSK